MRAKPCPCIGWPLSCVGPVIRPVGVAQRTRYSTAPWTFLEYLPRVGELPCARNAVPASAGHGHRVPLAAAGDPRAVVGLLDRPGNPAP